MKHSAKLLLPLVLLFFIAGCSMFRTQQTGTMFTFEYEGKTYEIAGYTNEVGESANYLITGIRTMSSFVQWTIAARVLLTRLCLVL